MFITIGKTVKPSDPPRKTMPRTDELLLGKKSVRKITPLTIANPAPIPLKKK